MTRCLNHTVPFFLKKKNSTQQLASNWSAREKLQNVPEVLARLCCRLSCRNLRFSCYAWNIFVLYYFDKIQASKLLNQNENDTNLPSIYSKSVPTALQCVN